MAAVAEIHQAQHLFAAQGCNASNHSALHLAPAATSVVASAPPALQTHCQAVLLLFCPPFHLHAPYESHEKALRANCAHPKRCQPAPAPALVPSPPSSQPAPPPPPPAPPPPAPPPSPPPAVHPALSPPLWIACGTPSRCHCPCSQCKSCRQRPRAHPRAVVSRHQAHNS